MQKEASIGIVLPYFGKLPNYFPLFLESCRNNPSIDWLFYTDSNDELDYPENVKVKRLSFDAFRSKLQESFDFPISLEQPYKLCDFKPTYGDTLKEDLVGYDFWGHCDCDLIWGNIRKFLTAEVTDRYDRIGNCGHLILYRNLPEINNYYRSQQYIDYREVLASPKGFSFDEWPGLSECWRRDGRPCFGELCYDDIRIGLAEFRPTQTIPGGFVGPYHNREDKPSRFWKMQHILYAYESGTLERCWLQGGVLHREETMYVHLQKRKMQPDDELLRIPAQPFLVIPNRFVPARVLTEQLHKELAPKSKNTGINFRLFLQILWYEVKSIGKRGFCSKSLIANTLSPLKKH